MYAVCHLKLVSFAFFPPCRPSTAMLQLCTQYLQPGWYEMYLVGSLPLGPQSKKGAPRSRWQPLPTRLKHMHTSHPRWFTNPLSDCVQRHCPAKSPYYCKHAINQLTQCVPYQSKVASPLHIKLKSGVGSPAAKDNPTRVANSLCHASIIDADNAHTSHLIFFYSCPPGSSVPLRFSKEKPRREQKG
jgi:hypothetical protein